VLEGTEGVGELGDAPEVVVSIDACRVRAAVDAVGFQSALRIVRKSDDVVGKRAVDGGWHERARLAYRVVGVAGAAGAIAHRR